MFDGSRQIMIGVVIKPPARSRSRTKNLPPYFFCENIIGGRFQWKEIKIMETTFFIPRGKI